MGCGVQSRIEPSAVCHTQASRLTKSERIIRAVILIQQWYRRYVARVEARRRCVWKIFQKLEYADEQDQLKLHNFFNVILTNYKFLLGTNECKETETFDVEKEVTISDDYEGAHVQLPMTLKCLQEMIISFKQAKTLHYHYVRLILTSTCELLQLKPNITQASTHISHQVTVCGDLHGNLDDLLIIFHKNGLPDNDNPYVFNGDFVDRGTHSVEVALLLFCLLLLYPSAIFINRGNHEDYVMNLRYGFVDEIRKKYAERAGDVTSLFNKVFSWLPIGCIVNNEVLIVHGGISSSTNLNFLSSIQRHKYPSLLHCHEAGNHDEWQQLFDVLWSDPRSINGCQPNRLRGGGVYFGPDITEQFLHKNNFTLLVRSHECKQNGFDMTHDKKVITVFSASNYYQHTSNKGAYLKMSHNLELNFVQFTNSNEEGHLKLSLRRRVSAIEASAIQELKEHVKGNRSKLLEQFKQHDPTGSGLITAFAWADSMEAVLKLGLPWHTLKQRLTVVTSDGMVQYSAGLEQFCTQNLKAGTNITEAIYRNRTTLEMIFRLIDKDNSGYITMSEFENCCSTLEKVTGVPFPSNAIKDMAVAMDVNNDGKICFNEFLESFRLTSCV